MFTRIAAIKAENVPGDTGLFIILQHHQLEIDKVAPKIDNLKVVLVRPISTYPPSHQLYN